MAREFYLKDGVFGPHDTLSAPENVVRTIAQELSEPQKLQVRTNIGVTAGGISAIAAIDITDSTAAGRALLTAATAAAQLVALGGAAASHTQALSTLTQSGATTSQVPAWNGTAWVPAPALGNDPAFFWDTANKRLGIGTTVPEVSLAVIGDINAGGNIVARSGSSGFGQSSDGAFRATNEPFSNYLAFSKDAGITLNAQGRNFGAIGSILTVQSSVALTVGNILRIKNGTTDMFAIDFNGNVNASGGLESAMMRLTPEPVGTLPTPTAGRIKVVNDATSTTPRSIAAGTGSNVCLVLGNGTNWLIV